MNTENYQRNADNSHRWYRFSPDGLLFTDNNDKIKPCPYLHEVKGGFYHYLPGNSNYLFVYPDLSKGEHYEQQQRKQ